MKVYLSASLSRRAEMRLVASQVRKAGHDVLSSWIDGNSADSELSDGDLRRWAVHSLNEVTKCDVLIAFTGQGVTGGRHVEFGFALALVKRCMLVGPMENAFHRLAEIERYETTEQAIGAL